MLCTAHQILFGDKIRKNEMGGHVYRVLLGRREGKRPLGRPRRSWEENIKMDLQ